MRRDGKNKYACMNKNLLSIILSVCSVIGIVLFVKIGTEEGIYLINKANNILYILLLPILIKGWKQVLKKTKMRDLPFGSILALIYSFALILGAQLDYVGTVAWSVSTTAKIIFLAIAILLGILCVFDYLDEADIYNQEKSVEKGKVKRKIFFVVFVLWGFTFLALFPGVYGYDAPNQILQGLGETPLTSHHPIIHTGFLGGCVKIGEELFGSMELGLGIYSLLQMTFMCYVVTEISTFVWKKTGNRKLLYGTIFFFIFLPIHPVLAVSATKDVIFAGIFVLTFLKVLEMVENPNSFCGNKKKIIEYIILIVFLCLFRNNGLYVMLFVLPFLLFFMGKYRKQMLTFTILAIVIFMIVQKSLFAVFDVEKGNGLREMLSIPCQQIARTYTNNPGSFSEKDKEILFELFPEDTFDTYSYRPMISDSIKIYLDTEELKKNPTKYVGLYVQQGFKNPKSYVEGAMINCLALWYPNKFYQDTRQYHPYLEVKMINAKDYSDSYYELKRKSLLPFYCNWLEDVFLNAKWQRIPIISSMFTVGTYTMLFVLWCILILKRKLYQYIVPASMIAGLLITIMLGPVSLVRYGYPLIMCAPILVMYLFVKRNTKYNV